MRRQGFGREEAPGDEGGLQRESFVLTCSDGLSMRTSLEPRLAEAPRCNVGFLHAVIVRLPCRRAQLQAVCADSVSARVADTFAHVFLGRNTVQMPVCLRSIVADTFADVFPRRNHCSMCFPNGFDAVGPCELRSEVAPDTSLGRARCA